MKLNKNTTVPKQVYDTMALPLMQLLGFDEYSDFVAYCIRAEYDRRRDQLKPPPKRK